MMERGFWLEAEDRVRLWTRRWSPDGDIKAVVNIVHGMIEHSERYGELACFLCDNSIEVWCIDMRGHGKTADSLINDEKQGGLLGHCADKRGVRRALQDIDMVHIAIKKEHKNIPLFLMGHSWGSFLVQGYIEFFKSQLAGVLLSGVRGPGGIEVGAGSFFLNLFASVRGVRARSQFVYKLVFGAYNKPFEPCRTSYDWLSRDDTEVDTYIADPFCGKVPTVGFFRDMILVLRQIYKIRHIEKIDRNLPLYIFSGCNDPVGAMGKNVAALVKKYHTARIKDLSYVLYPGARHECLHEINRSEVMRNLLTWLERHI